VRIVGLSILAQLSLRESLRSHVIQNDGIELFLGIVKQQNPAFDMVEAQRCAAKGLVNLVAQKRDLRLKAITDLSD